MARSTVLGVPVGKPKHPKRDLARNVAKTAAVVAGPALLVPAAKKAKPIVQRATHAAGQAGDLLEKGKEMKGQVAEAMDTADGIKDAIGSHSSTIGKVAGVVKAVASKGGNKGSKPKLSHLLEQHCDIAAPRRTVYDQWTQFEMFPTIVKGIESVQQQDDDETTKWTAKIGPSRRTWTGKIVEQIPDERIAWKSDGGAQLQGTVTFHDLDVDLTRVLLQMEYKPTGAVEWVGNTLRIQHRRTKRDLRLFKHFLEIRGEETGAWRGTIDADEKLEPAHSGQGKVQRDRRSQGSDRGTGTPAPDPNEEDGRSSSRRGANGASSSSGGRSSRERSSTASSGSRSSGNRSGGSRSGGSRSSTSGSRSGTSASRSGGGRSTTTGTRGGSGGGRSSSASNRGSGSRSSSGSGSSGSRGRPSSSGRSSSSSGTSRRSGNGSSSPSQGRRRQPARSGA